MTEQQTTPTTREPTIRVLVADDQAIVRDGLVTVLTLLPDVEVIGEAADGQAAVDLAAALLPDVVLMDLRMPVLDGAAATGSILRAHPGIAVLVLTTYADDASISAALAAGARGYLTKDASRAEVAAAIRSVASGQGTFAPGVAARLAGRFVEAEKSVGETAAAGQPAPFARLTPRELEVFALIGEGLDNHEIAVRLTVSVATVKTHINTIFAKLHVRTRAQAMALRARTDQ